MGHVLSTNIVATLGRPWAGEVDPSSIYLLDVANGATMLTIPFGHSADVMCQVLGDFNQISAIVAVRRDRVRLQDTNEILEMSAPDQVAVCGTLGNGEVASMHYKAVSARVTGFTWEINGTEGDLLVSGGDGHLQYGRVSIKGGQGRGATLADLPVPDSYRKVALPHHDFSYSIAHAYLNVLSDITKGTHLVPDFADALKLHSLIETVETAAVSGQRQVFKPATLAR